MLWSVAISARSSVKDCGPCVICPTGTPSPLSLNSLRRSSMYISKRSGLSVHPWATPLVTLKGFPSVPFILNCASAFVYMHLIIRRSFPLLPFLANLSKSVMTAVKGLTEVHYNDVSSWFHTLLPDEVVEDKRIVCAPTILPEAVLCVVEFDTGTDALV